jgi:hypothetical protein
VNPRILDLHARGLDAHEIAREVGASQDVVRLVLATAGVNGREG